MCTCEGTGIKLNPEWAKFYDWQAGQEAVANARLFRLIEHVYFGGDVPPEFVACECRAQATEQERQAA